MNIRLARESEDELIRAVHAEAFGPTEGPTVSQLAGEICHASPAPAVLSLVAEDDTGIIGSVIYSRVTVAGHEQASVFILCPLAVVSARQHQGVGDALVKYGNALLQGRGVEALLVYGDPDYYTRFGFCFGHGLAPPYTLEYPQAWMALELKPGSLQGIEGVVTCVTPLQSPEHW